jgi:RNA-directed DNA polymerase
MDLKKQNQKSTRHGQRSTGGGEAPQGPDGAEDSRAMTPTESQTAVTTTNLMEEICERTNLISAYQRVFKNKGGPGGDGMTVDDLKPYLDAHWEELKAHLLAGTYKPQPVKRVSIPKPNGGMRELGIPTVLDRFIQQAMLQRLGPIFDATFSEWSFGFRPKRSAHQAILAAQRFVEDGREWVVDIDLEKFFDRVNHDKLMGLIAKKILDKRVLRVTRGYLNAGVMSGGVVSERTEGTPQGGPLSPLLSNIVLNELDKELEKRGHCFVRYADDCNIYVRSQKAGQRTMDGLRDFIVRKLKLRINEEKSAVDLAWNRKFLGYAFYKRR